jgi:membrane protein insertase Oxa1/YidC/SpoIIIJ
MNNQSAPDFQISHDNKVSNFIKIPSLGTIASALAIIFLIYAFFSGILHTFYASFLFFFYSYVKHMWISVMLLGVFQTLLMIPFRVIRIAKSNNIQEFQHTVEKIQKESEQTFVLKKKFRQGNPTFLFYAVDFVMQIVSYVSLGRLFLTDFYNMPLDPKHLYSWVEYPSYPIQDVWFKIPYPYITKSIDFGWKVLLPTWIALVIIQLIILIFKRASKNKPVVEEAELTEEDKKVTEVTEKINKYTTGYLLFFMLIAWLLVRNFPVGWQINIFSGDVTIPNRTFNTVTAIATFITMLWHSIPKIVRKGHLAEKLGIKTSIIERTQKDMFKESLFTATLVGLGAFFITNQIPSAFELSIFTLEVISLLSPFTLDKLVLGSLSVKKEEVNEEEVKKEFR